MDSSMLIGFIGIAVGVAGIIVTVFLQNNVEKIRARNRAYSWRLASNVHNLMALLEQVEAELNKKSSQIEGQSSAKVRGFISRSYQQSTDIVSSIGEFLVVEFKVGRKELEKMKEKDFAWGHLHKSIERTIEAVENKKLA